MRTFLDIHCWLFSLKVTSNYLLARIYGYSMMAQRIHGDFCITFVNRGIDNV